MNIDFADVRADAADSFADADAYTWPDDHADADVSTSDASDTVAIDDEDDEP